MVQLIKEVAKSYNKPFEQVAHDFRAMLDIEAVKEMYENQRKSTRQLLDLAAGKTITVTKSEMVNIVRSAYFTNMQIEREGDDFKLSTFYGN
jgi:hypothetical protein